MTDDPSASRAEGVMPVLAGETRRRPRSPAFYVMLAVTIIIGGAVGGVLALGVTTGGFSFVMFAVTIGGAVGAIAAVGGILVAALIWSRGGTLVGEIVGMGIGASAAVVALWALVGPGSIGVWNLFAAVTIVLAGTISATALGMLDRFW